MYKLIIKKKIIRCPKLLGCKLQLHCDNLLKYWIVGQHYLCASLIKISYHDAGAANKQ